MRRHFIPHTAYPSLLRDTDAKSTLTIPQKNPTSLLHVLQSHLPNATKDQLIPWIAKHCTQDSPHGVHSKLTALKKAIGIERNSNPLSLQQLLFSYPRILGVSTVKIVAVKSYLKNFIGIEDAQFRDIVLKCPRIVTYSIARKIHPTVQYLADALVSLGHHTHPERQAQCEHENEYEHKYDPKHRYEYQRSSFTSETREALKRITTQKWDNGDGDGDGDAAGDRAWKTCDPSGRKNKERTRNNDVDPVKIAGKEETRGVLRDYYAFSTNNNICKEFIQNIPKPRELIQRNNRGNETDELDSLAGYSSRSSSKHSNGMNLSQQDQSLINIGNIAQNNSYKFSLEMRDSFGDSLPDQVPHVPEGIPSLKKLLLRFPSLLGSCLTEVVSVNYLILYECISHAPVSTSRQAARVSRTDTYETKYLLTRLLLRSPILLTLRNLRKRLELLQNLTNFSQSQLGSVIADTSTSTLLLNYPYNKLNAIKEALETPKFVQVVLHNGRFSPYSVDHVKDVKLETSDPAPIVIEYTPIQNHKTLSNIVFNSPSLLRKSIRGDFYPKLNYLLESLAISTVILMTQNHSSPVDIAQFSATMRHSPSESHTILSLEKIFSQWPNWFKYSLHSSLIPRCEFFISRSMPLPQALFLSDHERLNQAYLSNQLDSNGPHNFLQMREHNFLSVYVVTENEKALYARLKHKSAKKS